MQPSEWWVDIHRRMFAEIDKIRAEARGATTERLLEVVDDLARKERRRRAGLQEPERTYLHIGREELAFRREETVCHDPR